jgi:hypothetical protein
VLFAVQDPRAPLVSAGSGVVWVVVLSCLRVGCGLLSFLACVVLVVCGCLWLGAVVCWFLLIVPLVGLLSLRGRRFVGWVLSCGRSYLGKRLERVPETFSVPGLQNFAFVGFVAL